MRPFLIAAALMLAAPSAAQAPGRDLAAQAAAIRDLDFLTGDWLGQGWRDLPPQAGGQRIQSTQQLRVAPKASGLVLIVEGVSLRQPAAETKPSTASFAVISFDERTKTYPFRSFGFGELIEGTGRLLKPGVFEWTVPGAVPLRFTVDGTTPNQWKETGYRSADGGKTWTQTYALTAHRLGVR